MIYPETTGLVDARELRLRTLESIWIQGQLKIWGEWSYMKQGTSSGVMFQFCGKTKITKSAVKELLKTLKKNGCNKVDLIEYLNDVLAERRGNFASCTDKSGLTMDGVIAGVLHDNPGLLNILHQRYIYRKSKRQIATDLHEKHPDWCFATCRNRVDVWLTTAEYSLYRPMNDALNRNPDRFYC